MQVSYRWPERLQTPSMRRSVRERRIIFRFSRSLYCPVWAESGATKAVVPRLAIHLTLLNRQKHNVTAISNAQTVALTTSVCSIVSLVLEFPIILINSRMTYVLQYVTSILVSSLFPCNWRTLFYYCGRLLSPLWFQPCYSLFNYYLLWITIDCFYFPLRSLKE